MAIGDIPATDIVVIMDIPATDIVVIMDIPATDIVVTMDIPAMEATIGDTGLIIEAIMAPHMVVAITGVMEGSGLASVSKPEEEREPKCAGAEAPP